MKRSILIIGGMGPQASILLHQKIITKAIENGARSGDDFPAITHVSIPVPEFIDSPAEKHQALRAIKRHLYCLWRSRFYSYCHCLQYSAPLN